MYGLILTKHGIADTHNHDDEWYTLDIDKKYKTTTNYETYCYLRYMGLDAAEMFRREIKNFNI